MSSWRATKTFESGAVFRNLQPILDHPEDEVGDVPGWQATVG